MKHHRPISKFFQISVLASIAMAALTIGYAAKTRPNILFIFTDDQSHETIAHLGNQEIITPHLDRLAQNGVAFTNAYNMGAWHGAVCVASRTSINTGRAMWRAKQIEDKLDAHTEEGEFWSQLMKQAGYETYISGKWHVKAKVNTLFDHRSHMRGGMPQDTKEGYSRPRSNDTWSPSDPQFGGFWKGGQHWSEVVANDAEEYFKHAAGAKKPFFMYLAFNAPHDPRQSPKEYLDLYEAKDLDIPESFQPEYPYKQEMGCFFEYDKLEGRVLRDERLGVFPRTKEAVQLHRHEYYAAISHLDAQIGRILDALEASGQADNTYIFFTSDHGLACGHHGLLGKQNMYEHSMKAPLIVSGPSIPKNETRDAFVYLQDIMPTTLELAGAPKPDYVDFHTLSPLLKNKNASSEYDAIYGAYKPDLQRMVRVGNHKLILYPTAKVYRLYDLAKDPQEANDLAPKGGRYTKLSKKLFARLLALQQELSDELNLSSTFPELL